MLLIPLLTLGDWHWVARRQLAMEDVRDFDGHAVHRLNAQYDLIETRQGPGPRFQLGYQHACKSRVSERSETAPRVLEI